MDNFKASGHHHGKRINLSLPGSVQLAFDLKVQFMVPPVPTTPRLDKYTCTFTQAHNVCLLLYFSLFFLSAFYSHSVSNTHTNTMILMHIEVRCVWRVALGFFPPMVSKAVMKVVSLLG